LSSDSGYQRVFGRRQVTQRTCTPRYRRIPSWSPQQPGQADPVDARRLHNRTGRASSAARSRSRPRDRGRGERRDRRPQAGGSARRHRGRRAQDQATVGADAIALDAV